MRIIIGGRDMSSGLLFYGTAGFIFAIVTEFLIFSNGGVLGEFPLDGREGHLFTASLSPNYSWVALSVDLPTSESHSTPIYLAIFRVKRGRAQMQTQQTQAVLVKAITCASRPSWHPNHNTLFYGVRSNRDGNWIMRYDPQSGQLAKVVSVKDVETFLSGLSWTSDGSKFAFLSRQKALYFLKVFRSDGKHLFQAQLPSGVCPTPDRMPVWSDSGKYIAIVVNMINAGKSQMKFALRWNINEKRWELALPQGSFYNLKWVWMPINNAIPDQALVRLQEQSGRGVFTTDIEGRCLFLSKYSWSDMGPRWIWGAVNLDQPDLTQRESWLLGGGDSKPLDSPFFLSKSGKFLTYSWDGLEVRGRINLTLRISVPLPQVPAFCETHRSLYLCDLDYEKDQWVIQLVIYPLAEPKVIRGGPIPAQQD